MPIRLPVYGAFIGSALMALSLSGSYGTTATRPDILDTSAAAASDRMHAEGRAAFAAGRYENARLAYEKSSAFAERAGSFRRAAMDLANAGRCALLAREYGIAQGYLFRARQIAEDRRQPAPLIYTLNNQASLYLKTGAPDKALAAALEGIEIRATPAEAGVHAELIYQQAEALTDLHRFAEAEPLFRVAINRMLDAGAVESAVIVWANLGAIYLDEGRIADAEPPLAESLRLARTLRIAVSKFALTMLGRLRAIEGHVDQSEVFFTDALTQHESLTPQWVVYRERGDARRSRGDYSGALDDFRIAQKLSAAARASVTPTDEDRVALENFEYRNMIGLIESGNREFLARHSPSLAEETFDAAESARLWSLRALVPEVSDWRSRLPQRYWIQLSHFREASVDSHQAEELDRDLRQMELAAGAGAAGAPGDSKGAFARVREILDPDSVFFSFVTGTSSSWLWAVDRRGASVFALPGEAELRGLVTAFAGAVQSNTDFRAAGEKLYSALFGAVPSRFVDRGNWILEPDGPLYEVPFAALPRGNRFLAESTSIRMAPGALLLESGRIGHNLFATLGDPVFSQADPRYHGPQSGKGNLVPRLPQTQRELIAATRAWREAAPSSDIRVLSGADATREQLLATLASSPDVVHFATHIIRSPGENTSGMIALGLNRNGQPDYLAPREIVARRVPGALVVMNGCHSARGAALPGSGLMGLTRAWIAAGASAVVSTGWDVADDSTDEFMAHFYRSLAGASNGNPAQALRSAQSSAVQSGVPPSRWAAYFLLSRI